MAAARTIDPRIRQRRIEVRRTAGRRRLRRVLVLVAVVVVLVGLAAAARSPLLAVRHLRVEGASATSTSAIIEASGLHTGEPILGVSTAGARRAVERLPWIDTVSVRRALPGTVVVSVTERVPVAVVADGGGRWLEVDRTGRVLAAVGEAPPSLVVLAGAQPQARPGEQLAVPPGLLALAVAIPAPLRLGVAAVAADPGGLVLQLRKGGVVRLGDASDLQAKLTSVAAVLTSQGVELQCVAELDVTVATAPALTPRPSCA